MTAAKNPAGPSDEARARSAATRRRAKHKRMAGDLRLTGEWLVLSRDEVADMLTRPLFKDGLPADYLRGYLHLDD
jgi:hypothetical protein